jgi:hypothetical protein
MGKEKRVAAGGNIDTKNIIETGRRRRTQYEGDSEDEPRRKTKRAPVKKEKPTEKKPRSTTRNVPVEPVQEKVEIAPTPVLPKIEAPPKVKNPAVKAPVKDTKKFIDSKPVPKEELALPLVDNNSSPKKVEKKVEKTEKIVQTNSNLVKTTIPMEIARLGGQLKTWSKPTPRRRYRDSEGLIPIHIQEFCDAWNGESTVLENVHFGIRDFKFGQEFALKPEEYAEFKFFSEHSDVILIGDGNKLVCTLMSDSRQDFEVWLIEEGKDAIGPMCISALLSEMAPSIE